MNTPLKPYLLEFFAYGKTNSTKCSHKESPSFAEGLIVALDRHTGYVANIFKTLPLMHSTTPSQI